MPHARGWGAVSQTAPTARSQTAGLHLNREELLAPHPIAYAEQQGVAFLSAPLCSSSGSRAGGEALCARSPGRRREALLNSLMRMLQED